MKVMLALCDTRKESSVISTAWQRAERLMLRDPCEEVTALLARLGSVLRSSEQSEARVERA